MPTGELRRGGPRVRPSSRLEDPPASTTSAAPPSSGEEPSRRGPLDRHHDPLLATICHDLRAPLAAVMMGANFVLQTTPEDEASGRSRRVLQAMLRSCRQMERLVRDFGDLSEIEGGQISLRPGLYEAGEMVELAAHGVQAAAAARGIVVEVRPPGETVLVRCDRDRILRALQHLLDNAVRFSPDGVAVEVGVRLDAGGQELRFFATDHGPGLTEETKANLYDRMWHGARADRVGAGLGLAIVRGFARAHGGRIELEAEAGKPTTFFLVLPAPR